MNRQAASLTSTDAARSRDVGYRVVLASLSLWLAVHATAACLEFIASIRYPFELDYGEGIVWQQAELIPGPRMYGNSPDLPFIVFHYPPVYHLVVRAVSWVLPDFLAAGRLVSSLSTIVVALLVAGLVLAATKRGGHPITGVHIGSAVAAGLLALCVPAIRTWGLLMRVDMLAVALSLAGLLVGAWARGRFWGTTAALLLCVASVFTKQTQITAGLAIFLVALLLNPRGTIAAATIAGAVSLGTLAYVEQLTNNGFLHNIIGYNINRFSIDNLYQVFWPQQSSLPFAIVMLAAFAVLLRGVLPVRIQLRTMFKDVSALLRANPAASCRALLLIEFTLATLMLATTLKSGSNYNYLLEWLAIGCVLIGALLVELACRGADSRRAFAMAAFVLAFGVMQLPLQNLQNQGTGDDLAEQAALVSQIAGARKPVASENMTLLMRAGKPVIFEPAIVTELAFVGRWDETPLVEMIRSSGFAFMITRGNAVGGNSRRTPAVDAAMREAYPRVEQAGPTFWLHLPAS